MRIVMHRKSGDWHVWPNGFGWTATHDNYDGAQDSGWHSRLIANAPTLDKLLDEIREIESGYTCEVCEEMRGRLRWVDEPVSKFFCMDCYSESKYRNEVAV